VFEEFYGKEEKKFKFNESFTKEPIVFEELIKEKLKQDSEIYNFIKNKENLHNLIVDNILGFDNMIEKHYVFGKGKFTKDIYKIKLTHNKKESTVLIRKFYYKKGNYKIREELELIINFYPFSKLQIYVGIDIEKLIYIKKYKVEEPEVFKSIFKILPL